MDVDQRMLSTNHFWIGMMLWALLWFNEPYMFLRVNVPAAADGLEKWNMLVGTSFTCFLLYYWLVLVSVALACASEGANAGSGAVLHGAT